MTYKITYKITSMDGFMITGYHYINGNFDIFEAERRSLWTVASKYREAAVKTLHIVSIDTVFKNEIIDRANDFFGVDLRRKCRERAYTKGRQMLCNFLKETTPLQMEAMFGFDRSTVYLYRRNHKSDMIGWHGYRDEFVEFCKFMEGAQL
jgi:hypothetical protein